MNHSLDHHADWLLQLIGDDLAQRLAAGFSALEQRSLDRAGDRLDERGLLVLGEFFNGAATGFVNLVGCSTLKLFTQRELFAQLLYDVSLKQRLSLRSGARQVGVVVSTLGQFVNTVGLLKDEGVQALLLCGSCL